MYNSEKGQTDSTPFHTATGEHVYDGGIACPSKYSFGTKVAINNKIYKCNDRMNKRFAQSPYFDIWSASKSEAQSFGRQKLQVKVYES